MGIYNPRNTVIVTCRDRGFDDAVTLSWHSPVSHRPMLYAIFLAKKRKSFEMISTSREFCVNYLTAEQEGLALYCGSTSGHTTDKFSDRPIDKEECGAIDAPRITDCAAYLECRVTQITEAGDHYIVVGEVAAQVRGNMKKRLFQSNIDGHYTFTTTVD
jgi:flavin reductase (DIM6/NTAB) family NADH-FMN oxidoreductase RutF